MSQTPGLTWSQQAPLTADVELDDPPVSRPELWRRIVVPEAFWSALDDALQAFVEDASDTWELNETLRAATTPEFADAATQYVTATASDERGAEKEREFRRQARNLGGYGVDTSLEDVRDGPLALLQAADVVPDVVLNIDADWLDGVTSTQLRRWLSFLPVLATGCAVRVVVSPIAARRLVRSHAGKLPADSVQQLAQPSGSACDHARVGDRTPLPGDRELARDALDALDRDGPLLAVLRVLATTADQMLTYDALDRHVLLEDAPRATWRSRLSRLRDLGVVDRQEWAGVAHHRLTTAGLLVVQEDAEERGEEPPTLGSGWETEHTEQTPEPHSTATDAAGADGAREERVRRGDDGADEALSGRSVPPKSSSEGRVPIRGQDCPRDAEGRDAAAEGREVAESGRETGRPGKEGRMRPDRHAALYSVTNGADVVTCNRPVDSVSGRRTRYDEDREEVSVSVDYSDDVAVLAVRLCAALTEGDAWNSALSQERLDGAGGDLAGLVTSNPYILRKGRCLGYLANEDANGHDFRERLHKERRALLAMLDDLRGEDGEFRADIASEVARRAHGLLGTLAQLYDLLGIDIVREIRVKNYRRDVHDRRRILVKFLSSAIPKSARYGHYSAYRVLYEPRSEKRCNDNTLGQPDTRGDETGEHIGSWVISGPGADDLRPDLEGCAGREYDLQEDAENFAAFEVPVVVEDGWRRDAIATAVNRVGVGKNLEGTRATISTLAALLGSVHDVAAAIWGLGAEDEFREIDLAELRPALGRLPADRILPGVGGSTVSRVVAALLAVDEPLSASMLAERADVSTQSLRDNRDVLEAVGLVDVTEQGAGRASLWRFRLPFKSERFDDVPEREPEEYPGEGSVLRPSALLQERDPRVSEAVLAVLEGPLVALGVDVYDSEEWQDLVTDYRLDSLAAEQLADRWPWVRPWMDVIAALLGWDCKLFTNGWLETSSAEVRFGAAPRADQTTLRKAAD